MRQPSLTGEPDEDNDFLAALKEEALLLVKEDLCEWLTTVLGVEVNTENFITVLDTGVHVCRLAKLIQDQAQTAFNNGACKKAPPSSKISHRANAKTGTWFARDNTANFIQWCKDYGVKSECLFESEGLVMHRDERGVVLCLLELARIGASYGFPAPSLIKMEKEIEKEEKMSAMAAAPALGKKNRNEPQSRKNSAPVDDLESEVRDEMTMYALPTKNLLQIRRIQDAWHCDLTRISQGKYIIGGKQIFIRLRGRKAMVRVGGGWDTLDHYLATHFPQKIKEFSNGDAYFLHIKSRYKSVA
ncbi:hypothetical protein CAPTEDRAFT_136006 [Capitella teleta]|uniref:GAR domain-containing protein n=1 Tax=Capitella teleta TaxID=283909 RepID=R7UGT1_CAPTE|nr:hypothetical protein CAPTEDRAFT_136006 [Capitella teleta]|eukprot:ELU05308.1 hypothetical protein CAPTEDRAFT_136006 [Capitella teleta]